MIFFSKILFYLKVSRPGLWFATIWLYLLPTSQNENLLYNFTFWYGIFYVCFPLNFLVYGWNDMVDYDTDKLNPRKDSFWFGARGSKEQLQGLWKPIMCIHLLTIPYILYSADWKIVLVFTAFFLINWLYNLPKNGLRSKPPLELLCQIGYLLVVPFSILLNNTVQLPWQTYLYLFLFSIQSHLIGEVMDIIPDKKSGRKTTATILGQVRTKLLIIVVVLLEIFVVITQFKEYYFGAFLGFALIWLLLDLYLIFKNKHYTLEQMKLFALASNVVATITILYVWLSGCLATVQ